MMRQYLERLAKTAVLILIVRMHARQVTLHIECCNFKIIKFLYYSIRQI